MTKLKVFISYAHTDEDLKTELDKHLVLLQRSNKIDVWQDRKIMPGTEWDATILAELAAADIIILLVSVDFNASSYIWEKELKIAMERHEAGTARVIPIIARTCDWTEMPYAKLQALPTGAKPITSYDNKDEAYTDVAKNVRLVVDWMINK